MEDRVLVFLINVLDQAYFRSLLKFSKEKKTKIKKRNKAKISEIRESLVVAREQSTVGNRFNFNLPPPPPPPFFFSLATSGTSAMIAVQVTSTLLLGQNNTVGGNLCLYYTPHTEALAG